MDIKNKKQWETAFFEACQKGDIEEVRHLCQKKYLEGGWADIHLSGDYGFRWACRNGHLEVVKYLLTSQELKEAGHTFADLHANNNEGFRWACMEGHVNVIKYLLTSTELKEAGHAFADLHAEDDDGFRGACCWGQLDVIKYLLTSSELKEAGHNFADVHAEKEEGFCWACDWACENEDWEVVRWLIMDYGIEKSSTIEEIIKEYPQAQEYFRAREELQEIQTTLETYNPYPYPSSIEAHDADKRAVKVKKL